MLGRRCSPVAFFFAYAIWPSVPNALVAGVDVHSRKLVLATSPLNAANVSYSPSSDVDRLIAEAEQVKEAAFAAEMERNEQLREARKRTEQTEAGKALLRAPQEAALESLPDAQYVEHSEDQVASDFEEEQNLLKENNKLVEEVLDKNSTSSTPSLKSHKVHRDPSHILAVPKNQGPEQPSADADLAKAQGLLAAFGSIGA